MGGLRKLLRRGCFRTSSVRRKVCVSGFDVLPAVQAPCACVLLRIPGCIRACFVDGMLLREPVHSGLTCMHTRVRQNHAGSSKQRALHSERCQNAFVTESVNLKRKGTEERESPSPGSQSLSDWLSHTVRVRAWKLKQSLQEEHWMTAKKIERNLKKKMWKSIIYVLGWWTITWVCTYSWP